MTAAAAAPLFLSLAVAAPAAERADRLFLNGKLWTGDPSRPLAQALAVRGDRLLAVGGDELRALAGPGTAVVDSTLGTRRAGGAHARP